MADAMDPQRQIRCPSCSKPFVRRAHMLRHQQQHTSHKPYNCIFCSKPFQRKDVLRGHLFRCELRGSLAVPEKEEKGRKKSSCDSCVKLRTKCDSETPCSRCRDLSRECVRSKNTQKVRETLESRSNEQISINFLLNGPENDDFAGHFPTSQNHPDEQDNVELSPLLDRAACMSWSDDIDTYDAFFGADMSFDSFFGNFERSLFGAPITSSNFPPFTPGLEFQTLASSALEARTADMKIQLRGAANLLDIQCGMRSWKDLDSAIELITSTEIEHCLELYFHYYHRHCPIVHRPSFNPATVPLALLLSITALGGMYSKDPAKVAWLRQLLDVMEMYIYGLPGLRAQFEGCTNQAQAADDEMLYQQFQTLQGAYLILVAQYFSGNVMARRRARQERFTRVLAIARSFNLPRAQHERVVSIPDERSFQRWVRQETYIRTMNIMLSLDSAFGIFNNIPPRIDLCELDLQLPCDRQYFETSSYEDMVVNALFPRQKMKVFDAFQKLFIAPAEEAERFDPIQKNTLHSWDLLILIHLLYSFSWRQTFSNPLLRASTTLLCPPKVVLDPLKLAIRNWKTIWDETRASILPKDLPEMGFETSADSYWTLTRLLVHRFESKNDEAGGGMANEDSGGGSDGTERGGTPRAMEVHGLDIMPLESDCGSQASHLRKILETSIK